MLNNQFIDTVVYFWVDGAAGDDANDGSASAALRTLAKALELQAADPSVTEQDRADIMFGCELGIDAIAASFIRDGAAVEEIRNICQEQTQS